MDELGFDLSLTGFELGEIEILLDEASAAAGGEGDDEDLLPDPGPPVSRSGDLWILGEHRLLQSDARDREALGRLMGQDKADLAFTDPPYNVPIAGNVSGLGKTKHREFAFASGEMSEAEFTQFLQDCLTAMDERCRDGAILFVCMDWRHLYELTCAGRHCGLELKNLCVWNKDNGGMGSFYRSKHELVFVWKKPGAAHVNTFELRQHGRYRTNVWDYAGVNSFRDDRQEELALHPTVKPVALVADAIKDVSARGAIVLDPFLGSGTTLIAAQRTGRRCRAVEVDGNYVDVAIRRWQALTGLDAVLEASGQTFADLQLLRAAECARAGEKVADERR